MSTAIFADNQIGPSSPAIRIDGGMQFWAGLSYGSASLANYLVLSGRLHISPAFIGMAWLVATAVFVLFGVVLKVGTDRNLLNDPGFKTFRAMWGSLILGAAVLVAAVITLMIKFQMGANSAFVTAPIALCVYGIGWRMAAVMSRQKWLNALSLASFVSAIYLATLAGSPQQSLAYSLCLIVVAIMPGLVLLLRRTPA